VQQDDGKTSRLEAIRERSPAVAEKVARTALSGLAAQYADNGYSRHGNFGVSVVRSMF